MNFVEPIRDRRKIAQIKNLLKGQERWRDLLLFTVGINSALRVSDLLQLQIGQFVDAEGNAYEKFTIREQKRGKRNEVGINVAIDQALRSYVEAYPEAVADADYYAFFNTKTMNYREPIQRGQAWKIISELCSDIGLRGDYGTHTLRKTWAYHARLAGVDLTLIMEKLNHNSLAYTKRYLGITDDELLDVARRLNL
jgi:integrase